LQTDKKRK